MPNLIIILVLSLLASCAKISYVVEQGYNQVALEVNGRENSKVIADDKVAQSDKDKIESIIQYKRFFYKYFKKTPTGIYDQTTFLDSEAVTYLVIAAPFDKLEPVKVSFPIAGEFPYLGFFNKESALEYKKEKDEEKFHTYIRPVYAYSTLNRWIFDDNILSSFFHLNEHQLAELIFHELFHTVFFVKDTVDLNENLANYFGKELTKEFFKYSEEQLQKLDQSLLRQQNLNSRLMRLANRLQDIYDEKKPKDFETGQSLLKAFLKDEFKPEVLSFCEEYKIEECKLSEGEGWNNARFAAFKTYEKDQNFIAKIHQKRKSSLLEFFHHIENRYKEFEDQDKEKSFEKFLKKKEEIL